MSILFKQSGAFLSRNKSLKTASLVWSDNRIIEDLELYMQIRNIPFDFCR